MRIMHEVMAGTAKPDEIGGLVMPSIAKRDDMMNVQVNAAAARSARP